MNTEIIKLLLKKMMMLLVIGLMFTACGKDEAFQPDEPGKEEPEPEIPVPANNNFYKLIRVSNFAADTANVDEDPTGTKATVFYSLEHNKGVDEKYLKTSQWDMAFGGLYNSFISGNYGSDVLNYGTGNNAVGGIAIYAVNFNDMKEIPKDIKFKTEKDAIGPDAGGDFGIGGPGGGWYLYDFGGTLVGDGSYDKQHVAYAYADTRTVVVRTANGNTAKVRMISVYKDIYDWDKMFRKSPHTFLTFEYVMIPKGETKFVIK